MAAVAAEQLASQGTLFEDTADERVYLVTYTNELVNYVSRQLPDIIGSETAHVAVRTVHAYLKAKIILKNIVTLMGRSGALVS